MDGAAYAYIGAAYGRAWDIGFIYIYCRGALFMFDFALHIAVVAVLIYLTARIVSFLLNRKNKCVKLPPKLPGNAYRLIYSDQKQVDKIDDVEYGKVLKSTSFNISGKPDYIYRHKKGGLLIAELKSGEIGEKNEPHFGDLMQLVSYFCIAEEYYGESPHYGLVIYKDHMFRVRNTRKLKRELKSLLKDMRDMLKHGEAHPAASFVRCRNCMCNGTVCEYTD